MKSLLVVSALRIAIVLTVGVIAYLAGQWHLVSMSNAEFNRIAAQRVTPEQFARRKNSETMISDKELADSAREILQGKSKVIGKNGPIAVLDRRQQDSFIAMLIADNHEEGLAELAKLPPGADTASDYAITFGDWAHEGGRKAADAAATAYNLPMGANRNAALNAVIETWIQLDAKATLDWASTVSGEDSAPLKNALYFLSTNLHEPELAAQYVDKFADATARAQSIGTIAKAMARTNPVGALGWLDKTAAGDVYDASVKLLITDLARQNPAQAASLLQNITEPATQATAITILAGTWGAADPHAALAWVSNFPDSEASARNSALSSAIFAWAKIDPVAVLNYIQSAPDPSVYASIIPAVVQALAKTNLTDQQKAAMVQSFKNITNK